MSLTLENESQTEQANEAQDLTLRNEFEEAVRLRAAHGLSENKSKADIED